MTDLGLKLKAVFVTSERNKAYMLMQIKNFLVIKSEEVQQETVEFCCSGCVELDELHNTYHVGVDMTYLVRKVDLLEITG